MQRSQAIRAEIEMTGHLDGHICYFKDSNLLSSLLQLADLTLSFHKKFTGERYLSITDPHAPCIRSRHHEVPWQSIPDLCLKLVSAILRLFRCISLSRRGVEYFTFYRILATFDVLLNIFSRKVFNSKISLTVNCTKFCNISSHCRSCVT